MGLGLKNPPCFFPNQAKIVALTGNLTDFKMPCDAWVFVQANVNASVSLVVNGVTEFVSNWHPSLTTSKGSGFVPVQRGDVIRIVSALTAYYEPMKGAI